MHGAWSPGLLPCVLLFQRAHLDKHCGVFGLDDQHSVTPAIHTMVMRLYTRSFVRLWKEYVPTPLACHSTCHCTWHVQGFTFFDQTCSLVRPGLAEEGMHDER